MPAYNWKQIVISSWKKKSFSLLHGILILLKLLTGKIKNLFMLSVRISSYECTRKVWRARKMRGSSSRRSRDQLQLSECSPSFPSASIILDIRTAKSMSKFVYNRATTRICAKKPFIENSHYAQKKVNKRPYWLIKNASHLLLWFQREHVIQLTDNCEWKAQNLWEKWRKSKPDELVSLKNVLEVRDPKLSRVLNIQMMFTLPKNLRNVQLASFFQIFFVACWIRT